MLSLPYDGDMDKETKKEFNNLARMIKKGFDDVDERFNGVRQEFNGLRQETNRRFNLLEQGHEDIKLKLDQVVYRFELNELEKRVRKVELKLGLRKS